MNNIRDDNPIRNLTPIICVVAIFGVSLGLTVPLIAIVLDSQGHSASAIGLHASTQFLGIMLASPITPWLMRTVGNSRLVAVSLGLMAFTFTAFPLATGFFSWLFLRLFLGTLEGVIFISAETWINQMAPISKRGRTIGVYGTFLAGGIAAGPLLLELTGVQGGTPFFVGAILTVFCLAVLLLSPQNAPNLIATKSRSAWKMAQTIPIAIASTILFGFLDAAVFGLLPIYGLALDFSPINAARLVTVLVLGGMVFQYPLGLLADYINRQYLLVACAGLASFSMLLIPIVADFSTPVLLLLFITGGMIGALWTIPLIIFGENFTDTELATVNSMAAVLYGLGSIIGPSVVGFSMTRSPHALMLTMATATMLLVLFGFLIYWKTGRSP